MDSTNYKLQGARLNVASMPHAALFREVATIRHRVRDSSFGDVSGEVPVLKQDMNSFLESIGIPHSFVKDFRDSMAELRAATNRIHDRL